MTYQCEKGCKDPAAKGGREWHDTKNECPYENYNPKLNPGRPKKQRAKGHPGSAPPGSTPPSNEPTARLETKVPTGGDWQISDKKADVTKGASKPVVPVKVDYIVDADHTKALCNFGFRIVYFIHVKIDEWVFDWHKHLPREQFQLTKNAEMSIDLQPRNFYSRGVTWFTMNVCRAPNLERAHAAIDSILFFEAFGGVGVALIFHYENVYKNSPKLKAIREAKKLKADRLKGAVETTARAVPEATPAPAPVPRGPPMVIRSADPVLVGVKASA